MKNRKKIATQILLVLAILVGANILSDRLFFRLDFTSDKRYTLSEATKNILRSLNEPVTITAYFTEDLPPDIATTRRDFKDLLVEYAAISNGMVLYEFVDPNKDPEEEQKAFQAGIQPVIVSTREKDESVQKKVFLGAKIQMGDQSDVIPFMQPGAAMEYSLSTSIKKLSLVDKPLVGFIQGYGQPAVSEMAQVVQSLSILYNVEPLSLSDAPVDLTGYIALAIVGPRDSIPEEHFALLDQYLAEGGNLLIAIDRVDGDLSTARGSSVETGLETWLSAKGLQVENNFIIDDRCGSVGVQQRQGFFNFTTNVKFPYLPLITNFADHPITKGLDQVILPFASSIRFTGDTTMFFQPIAFTSEKSGTLTPPLFFDINRQWTKDDFPLSKLPVGVILKGRFGGNAEGGIVLFSDGQFPVGGEGRNAQQLSPDNVSLFVNSIDWLADDTGLIDLRTKGVTARPLDQVEEGRKAFLKWLNFLLPIALVLVYGVIRAQRRRMIRVKRMEKGYI